MMQHYVPLLQFDAKLHSTMRSREVQIWDYHFTNDRFTQTCDSARRLCETADGRISTIVTETQSLPPAYQLLAAGNLGSKRGRDEVPAVVPTSRRCAERAACMAEKEAYFILPEDLRILLPLMFEV